jgi:periplasmic copper chaperone A
VKQRRLWLIIAGLLLFFLSACTTSGRGLEVRDAWARPGFTGGSSGVYLVINNRGGQADELISASTRVAQVTELHLSQMDHSGTMRMEPLQSIQVEANANVPLAPGGLHIMLVNLQQDLNPGDTFELELNFREHGPISLTVPVRSPE